MAACRLDSREFGQNWFQECGVSACQLYNLFCRGTEFGCQMASRSFGEPVLAGQLLNIVVRESLTTIKNMVAGLRLCRGHAQRLLDSADRIFGHGAMRCPLSAHDADEPPGWVPFDYIVARQFFCVAVAFRADKRPGARTAADDFVRSNRS